MRVPTAEEGADAVARLGVDVPAWAAELRAKVGAAIARTKAGRKRPAPPPPLTREEQAAYDEWARGSRPVGVPERETPRYFPHDCEHGNPHNDCPTCQAAADVANPCALIRAVAEALQAAGWGGPFVTSGARPDLSMREACALLTMRDMEAPNVLREMGPTLAARVVAYRAVVALPGGPVHMKPLGPEERHLLLPFLKPGARARVLAELTEERRAEVLAEHPEWAAAPEGVDRAPE